MYAVMPPFRIRTELSHHLPFHRPDKPALFIADSCCFSYCGGIFNINIYLQDLRGAGDKDPMTYFSLVLVLYAVYSGHLIHLRPVDLADPPEGLVGLHGMIDTRRNAVDIPRLSAPKGNGQEDDHTE